MESDCHAGQLGSLLTPGHKQALGCVNRNWFNDLSLKACTSARKGLNRTPHPTAQDDSVVYPNDGLNATLKVDDRTQPYNPMMSTPRGVTPALFSPAGPQGAVCGIDSRSRWKRVKSGSTLSPATPGAGGVVPGLGCITPGLGAVTLGGEAFTPLSTLLHPHNTSSLCSYQEGSSFKRLFKTPSSVGSGVPRNRHVTQLTGIDLNETDVSWTESLATPSNTHILQSDGLPVAEEQPHDDSTSDVGNIGVARMLFSPRGASVPSQEEGILPLNNTLPEEVGGEGEEADSADSLRVLACKGGTPHVQKTKTCDVTNMKENELVKTDDTSDIVTPTVTTNNSHQCWRQSTCDTPLTYASEISKLEGHSSGSLLHSGIAEMRSLGIEIDPDISSLNITSELNRFEPEVMSEKDTVSCHSRDGTEEKTVHTDVHWIGDTEGLHCIGSGVQTQFIESKQKPVYSIQCDENNHRDMTNLSTSREDKQEAPFCSPSQSVSVREALSIFDTPPSCATLKKKSVPRRSKRRCKVAPHTDRFANETPPLLLDDEMVRNGGCDSSESQPKHASRHSVDTTNNQVKSFTAAGENTSESGLRLNDNLEGRSSESQCVQLKVKAVNANQNDKDGCQSIPKFCRTSAKLIKDETDTTECSELVHHSDNGMIDLSEKECDLEIAFVTSARNGSRLSPLSKLGGDDGFTQISQATLSAACKVVDNLSTVVDCPSLIPTHKAATSPSYAKCGMKSRICAMEKENVCREVGDVNNVSDSNMTKDIGVVCRQECVDKVCEDKGKVCSACDVRAASEMSTIAESEWHITETAKCVVCSASNEACSAASDKVCSASHRVCCSSGSKVCNAKKEACSVDSNKVCSATMVQRGNENGSRSTNTRSYTNIQCVNTDVKMCSAGANKRPKVGQLKCDNGIKTDRIAINDDTAFTQISPSMIDAILHVTDSSHDMYSPTTNIGANPSADSQLDPLGSDWLECRPHKSCITPSKMTYKHCSSDNVCKTKDTPHRVHKKILSKQSPITRTVTHGGSNVGGSHVAKQPGSNIVKSKTLSLCNRKTKRFSYPSVKQISSMCPQRVFNLKTDAFSVTDISPRNAVELIDEKSAGKTESSISDRSYDSTSVISSDRDKGLVRTETREKTAKDMTSRTLNKVETVKDKENGMTNHNCPNIEGTSIRLQSETEGDDSSMGKDAGRSLQKQRGGKPRLVSTSGTSSEAVKKQCLTGFATASNKAVSISKAALETAQELVAECDRDDSSSCRGNTGSKIRSMPSTKVHCESSTNTGQRRQNAHQLDQAIPSENNSLDHVGFKTASAKPIHVSDNALKKALALGNCDDSFSLDNAKQADGTSKKRQVTNIAAKVADLSTYSSAAGVNCDAMSDAITEAESHTVHNLAEDKIISSTTSGTNLAGSSLCKTAPTIGVKNVGFHTASHKEIKVSDGALVVAQKLIEKDSNISLGDGNLVMKHGKNPSIKNANSVDKIDQETYIGNKVTPCDSLRPVKDRVVLAAGGEISTPVNTVNVEKPVEHKGEVRPETITRNPLRVSTKCLGFQCASGKTINISKESLQKAVKLMDTIKEDKPLPVSIEDEGCRSECDTETTGVDVSGGAGDFAGFLSASGKKIILKEESIKKAKLLVGSDDMENLMSHGVEEEHSKSKFVGTSRMGDVGGVGFTEFQCASEKEVHLTEQSLERAKMLMNVIDEQMVQEGGSEGANEDLQSCGKDNVDRKEHKPVDVTGCGPRAAGVGGCDISRTAKSWPQRASVRSEMNQCVSSETKDYSHLPKGFRPFKAPRMVAKKTLLQHKKGRVSNQSCSAVLMQMDATKSPDHIAIELEVSAMETTTTEKDVAKSSDVPGKHSETEAREQLSMSSHGFDDEGFDDLTYTQISEITDLTVICLQHQHEFDDGSFGQTSSPVTNSLTEPRAKVHSKRLGVIIEETTSGSVHCAGKEEESREKEIGLRPEGHRTCVVSDTDCGDNDNMCKTGRGDPVQEEDMPEKESAVTDVSLGRDAPVSTALQGKRVVGREKAAGRSENLWADISQLSEWEGDSPHSNPHLVCGSGTAMGDPSLTCYDNKSNLMVLTIRHSSCLFSNDPRNVSLKDCSRTLSDLSSSTQGHTMRPADDKDGCPSAEIDRREVQPSISATKKGFLNAAVLGFQTAHGGVVRVSAKALVEAKRLLEDSVGDAVSSAGNEGVVDVVSIKQKNSTAVAPPQGGATVAYSHATDGAISKGCSVCKTESPKNKSALVYVDATELHKSEIGTTNKVLETVPLEAKCTLGCDNQLEEATAQEEGRVAGDLGKKAEDCARLHQIEQSGIKLFEEMAEQKSDQQREGASGFRQVPAECSGVQIGNNNVMITSEEGDVPQGLTDSHDAVLPGFTTAAGHKVVILEEALQESRKIFHGSSSVDCRKRKFSEEIHGSVRHLTTAATERFQGFHTAAGKKVAVSDSALKEAKNMFDNDGVICKNSKLTEDQQESLHPKQPCDLDGITGFQTASGKTIPVSENALKESRKIFDTESNSITKNVKSFGPSPNTGSSSCAGLLSAKGNKDSVLERALEETEKNFNASEFDCKDSVGEKNLVSYKSISREVEHFSGFTTARGNEVSVSEEALKESRKVFDGCETSSVDFEQKDASTPAPRLNSGDDNFVGFTTARGNKVSMSEKALKESRKILDNNEHSFVEPDSKNTTLHGQSPNTGGTHFTGFATARGNKVSVSDKALKESRTILDKVEHSFLEPDSKNTALLGQSQNTLDTHFTGFATARGNKVSVSDKALRESRKVFDSNEYSSSNFESKNTTLLGQSPNTVDTRLTGFATARGNKVSVSDKALKESRKLFAECENHLPGTHRPAQDLPEDAGNVVSQRVRTNNRASLQANGGCTLTRSDEMLCNRETENDPTGGTLKKSEVCSPFQTAAGSKVHVSNTALAGARCMLGDGNNEGIVRQQSGVLCMNDDDVAESDIRLLLAEVKQNDDTLCGKSHPSTQHSVVDNKRSDEQLSDRQNISKADIGEDDIGVSCAVSDRVEEDEPDSRTRRWQHRTSTPAINDHDRSWKTTSVSKGEGTNSLRNLPQWLSPITSSPDECLRDRASGSRLVALRNVHITPAQGNLGKGDSRGTLRSVGMPLKGVTPKRPLFMGSNTKNHSSHQLLSHTGRQGTFAPPFKKTDSAFFTPYKPETHSSFKTPMKSSGDPDQLRKRLAFAEKSSPHPEKKLRLDVVVSVKCNENHQNKQSMGSVTTETSVKEMKMDSAHISENAGNNDGSELQQNNSEENTNLAPDNSKVKALLQQREAAYEAQLKRIAEKQRAQSVKPIPGKLFTLKTTSHRVSLKDAVSDVTPGGHTMQQLYSSGVRTSTLHVTAANAEEFRFMASEYFTSESLDGVRLGDGAFLIFCHDGTAGKEEFCNAFLDMAGVEPALVSCEWVYNHYRWIVWKLAAMEVAFPGCFAGRSLMPDQVMLQFKYRYDREIDRSHRSALKKIYERDDVAQKTLVLCISAIRHQPTPAEVARSHGNTGKKGENKDTNMGLLELTDGWYPIRASLDAPLTRLVARHKIQVGDKLCISGAELIGPREGAPPLQGVEETSLKLSANCTRRARWGAKLGYTFRPHPMLVSLGSLIPDGGTVGGLDVTVTRVYPLQFMEKLADGSNVFRCARAEEKESQKFERQRQRTLEDAYGKIQAEFERRSQLQTGDGQDEEVLQAEFQQRLAELQQELPSRNAVSLLKVRLAGLMPADIDSHASAMLSVWRPSPEVVDMLTEGRRFKIYHLVTSEARGRQSGVALSAMRTTQYLSVPVDDNLLDLVYEPREVMSFEEMREDMKPLYGEVDVAGIVVRVSDISTFDRPGSTEGCVQTVYLADCDDQMIAVKFWRGVAAYGLRDLLTVGSVVAGTNLQWRYDGRNRLPTVTANELSVFSVKPRQAYQNAAIHRLQAHLKETKDFVVTQQSRLQRIVTGLPAPVTPQPTSNTTRYMNDYSITTSTPNSSANNCLWRRNTAQDPSRSTTPVSTTTKYNAATYTPRRNPPRSLSGDFPSTPGGCCNDVSVENESPLVARQRAIQRAKARRLESYGNPMQHLSPLPSPIPVALWKAFKSPLVGPRVVTPMKDPSSCDRTVKMNPPSLVDNDGSRQGHAGNDFSDVPSRSAIVECRDIESGEKDGVEGGHLDPQNGQDGGNVKGSRQLLDHPCTGEVSKVVTSDYSGNNGSSQTGWSKKNKCGQSVEDSNRRSPPARRKSLRLSKQQSAD